MNLHERENQVGLVAATPQAQKFKVIGGLCVYYVLALDFDSLIVGNFCRYSRKEKKKVVQFSPIKISEVTYFQRNMYDVKLIRCFPKKVQKAFDFLA